MQKARRSMRRGAARLVCSDPIEGDLSVALNEWLAVKNSVEKFAECQSEASECMMKWALQENNRAIKDTVLQFNELVHLWTKSQKRFADNLQSAVGEFDKVREAQRRVKEADRSISTCVQQEEKIKKDIKSSSRWRKGGDVRLMQHTLECTSRNRRIAEQAARETKNEQEIFKIIHFKRGMQRLAQSYLDMSRACGLIFEAHQDVCAHIPEMDNFERPISEMQYEGGPYQRQRVEVVRRRVSEIFTHHIVPDRQHMQRRRLSDTAAHRNSTVSPASFFASCSIDRQATDNDPPPPYSP